MSKLITIHCTKLSLSNRHFDLFPTVVFTVGSFAGVIESREREFRDKSFRNLLFVLWE
jgi:hypothetical protein